MSRLLRKNEDVLKFLRKAKPCYRKAVLSSADKNLVLCICECAHNTLLGKVPLSKSQKLQLSKHKKTLRCLVKPRESFVKKKKILVQKGGAFLPFLLAPIISGILSAIVSK